MMKQILSSQEEQDGYQASWYRALSLTERAIILQKAIPEVDPALQETADKRFQRWKEQPPFSKGSYFSQRLAIDELTEEDLLILLAESTDGLRTRLAETAALPWLTTIIDTFKHYNPETALLRTYRPAQKINNPLAFLDTIEPLINDGLVRIKAGIQVLTQAYTVLPFDPERVLPLTLSHIPDRLLPKLMKTFVLELNIARMQGHLQGETAEERFFHFIELLSQPENILSFFEEYVVLARQLVESIDMWVDYELELLTRLCDDWPEIQATMAPAQEPGRLVDIQAGQGDTHKKGRSVTVLVWESGFRIVYKPRSLAVDAQFQELLRWLNQHGWQPEFQTINFVNKVTHGWVEFVAARTCTSQDQLQRFYRRQGGYLALLYALAATDFHAENVIAAGEHPILIDLEALFHPYMSSEIAMQKQGPAIQALDHSVLRIGLLPQRIWSSARGEGIDISGLGGAAGQLTPIPVARWADIGTDNMQLRLEHVAITLGNHRPTLAEQDVDPHSFCDEIIAGFRRVYQLLQHHHQELLTEVLPRFAQTDVRCLVRATGYYAILINNSFHPDILRDALERDRYFDRLWIQVEEEALLARIIPMERQDLMRADVPIFTTQPASLNLYSSQGEMLTNFFEESGLSVATRQIQAMDTQDLERQEWMIKAAFASLAPVADRQLTRLLHLAATGPAATKTDLIAEATRIGKRIVETALQSEESVEWLELLQVGEQEWQVTFSDGDLYAGTAGMTLFLAYLGNITGDTQFTSLARKALMTTHAKFQSRVKDRQDIRLGAFNGIGGFIYLLTQLGILWDEPELLRDAEQLACQLPGWIAQDVLFDISGGTAGFLVVLLSLYKVYPTDHLLEVALQCGEYLLTHTRSTPEGIGWGFPADKAPLTGFSRGVAGIAMSLFQLAAVSGERRFYATALAALEYERQHYSVDQHNWSDLRTLKPLPATANQTEPDALMVAWCHGAAGIALARLGSPEACQDAEIVTEIEVALQTVLSAGFGGNHSLCHGDLGNLDILLCAQHMSDQQKYQADIERLTAILVQSIKVQGWITGVPEGLETPGLMTGLAGIGYALLRLAAPAQIPSVLLLAGTGG
ncbi:lanthionine synthetase [Dictyobacter vulcani]|uniref:Lanthionine synthetase n=1 Tax=Dictyobacter vulcani TaxID=2607529 RepID=A0A5J4KSX4_9CHLR|nr:type 2 lanthipeptide synthetase LanM family protein [Dictyobacter vulcani]GER89541.1 lanthionine synthetase [Dictyobacter vulcani]